MPYMTAKDVYDLLVSADRGRARLIDEDGVKEACKAAIDADEYDGVAETVGMLREAERDRARGGVDPVFQVCDADPVYDGVERIDTAGDVICALREAGVDEEYVAELERRVKVSEKFEKRFEEDGYSEAVEHLSYLWERGYAEGRDRVGEAAERVAEEYGLGINTVIADAARASESNEPQVVGSIETAQGGRGEEPARNRSGLGR